MDTGASARDSLDGAEHDSRPQPEPPPTYEGPPGLGPSPELVGIPNITGGPMTRGASHTSRPRLVRTIAFLLGAVTVATVVASVLPSGG